MAGPDLAVTVVISPADRELLRSWWAAAGGPGDAPRPRAGHVCVFALACLADPPPGWVSVAVVTTDSAGHPGTVTVDGPVGGRSDERRRLLLGIVSHLRSDGWTSVRTSVPDVAAALREVVSGPAHVRPGNVTTFEL